LTEEEKWANERLILHTNEAKEKGIELTEQELYNLVISDIKEGRIESYSKID
jgi:hypothetical protein